MTQGQVVDRETARCVCGEHWSEADADHRERGRQRELDPVVDSGSRPQRQAVTQIGNQLASGAEAEPRRVAEGKRVQDLVPAGPPDQAGGGRELEPENDSQR